MPATSSTCSSPTSSVPAVWTSDGSIGVARAPTRARCGRRAGRRRHPRLPARRGEARLNFFADTTVVSPARVPPATGQEIDLSFGGVGHRLTVFALGSWRYRVHLDGRTVTVTLREGDGQRARLEFAGRTRRIAYDATEVGLRLELDARAYRFGWGTMGHVRASAPALVVAIQVRPGDRVAAGQLLGFLEAMKVEIGFSAPVAGVVTEIRATKGQLVPAGSVLLVIQPDDARSGDGAEGGLRLELSDEGDSLGVLVTRPAAEALAAMDAWPAARRASALAALRDEVHGVLLGYDADPPRADWLAAVLASAEPGPLCAAARDELAALAAEITVFADVEQLFLTAPRITAAGQVNPSNASRLRAYLRRMRAGGAGIAEDFLELLKAALRHYGVESLDHDDALERALLRVFATQNAPDRRRPAARRRAALPHRPRPSRDAGGLRRRARRGARSHHRHARARGRRAGGRGDRGARSDLRGSGARATGRASHPRPRIVARRGGHPQHSAGAAARPRLHAPRGVRPHRPMAVRGRSSPAGHRAVRLARARPRGRRDGAPRAGPRRHAARPARHAAGRTLRDRRDLRFGGRGRDGGASLSRHRSRRGARGRHRRRGAGRRPIRCRRDRRRGRGHPGARARGRTLHTVVRRPEHPRRPPDPGARTGRRA